MGYKIILLVSSFFVANLGFSSTSDPASFFEVNKDKYFEVRLSKNQKKVSKVHWNDEYYFSNFFGFFHSKEQILEDSEDYHLLTKIKSVKLLWFPVPVSFVNFLLKDTFGASISYVGVTIHKYDSKEITAIVSFLNKNHDLERSIEVFFTPLKL